MASRKGSRSSSSRGSAAAGVFSPQRLKTQKGKDALVQELKVLHEQLVHFDPAAINERPDWMDKTCPIVVSKRILNHQHKDVRLMACCCVVEILRVYAPEAPFTDEQMKNAFEAIIIELRGLQQPERASFERVYSILESLANVKSCAIVVVMAEDGNDELVSSLFQVLLQAVRPEHSIQTKELMVEVMKTCIEEFQGPVPEVLIEMLVEAVLLFRAPSEEEDDETEAIDATQRACGALAAEVCRAPELEKPLQLFLNRLAIGYGLLHNRHDDEDDEDLQVIAIACRSHHVGIVSANHHTSIFSSLLFLGLLQDLSPLQDRMFEVAAKLSSISDSLLLKALPTLCSNLTNPEKDVRAPVIGFVGELFAAEGSTLPSLFATSYRQWLDRFQDCDTTIRKTMVESTMAILFNHVDPAVVEPAAKYFKSKLCDPDKDVRRRAVQCTCELAANGCTNVSNSLLRAVGDRCTDRVAIIRMDAITGLAQVYKHVIASTWERIGRESGGDSEDEDESGDRVSVTEAQQKRLGWIPAHVVKTFNINDVELRSRVLQLIDEILLPKSLTPLGRAKGFVYIYSHLDSEAKNVLGRVFAIRKRIQTALQEFADNPKDDQAVAALQRFVLGFKGVEIAHVEALRSVNDKRVFALLRSLAEPDAQMSSLRKQRIDVLKRLGSKSPQAALVKQLLRYASMTSVDVNSIEHICSIALGAGAHADGTGRGGGGGAKKKSRAAKRSNKARAAGGASADTELEVMADHEAAIDLLLVIATNFPTATLGCIDEIISHLLAQGHGMNHAAKVAKCFRLVVPAAGIEGETALQSKKFLSNATKRFLPAVSDRPPHWAKSFMDGMCAYLHALCEQQPKKYAKAQASFLERAVEVFTNSKALTLANPRLDSVLQALGAVVQASPQHLDDEVDDVLEFVFSHCLSASAPPATETGGKKKTNTAWRSVVTAATKFLVRVVVGTHVRIVDETVESDIAAERKQRSADIAAKLFSVAQSTANTVASKAAEQCTDNREHVLICCCRSMLKIAGSFALEPAQWHALAWSLRDSSAFVRSTMLAKFKKTFIKYEVRPQFLCALALPAEESRNSRAVQFAGMQLKGLINRQRASYQKVLSDMDEDDSDAQVQLELLEVETCVAHFVHLLAHHPELTSADGVAAAVEFHKQQGRDGPLPSAVALKELVTAGADSGLKQWANGVGRNGLLKGMTDQMDFLLKALFEGQQNLQNAELINAILRTIHEAEDALEPDNRNIHVISEMMQGRVRKIMEKVATAPKPYPGTIRLDSKCYSRPRPRRRESAMTAIAGNLSMSTFVQSPEHSSMDHSMGSFLNHGRDTLLPDDFDAVSRRSTMGAPPKRKSPQSASKDGAKSKVQKKDLSSPKKVSRNVASPTRRSTRVARAPRPNYAEDRDAEEQEQEQEQEDAGEEESEQATSAAIADDGSADEEEESVDQENDARQAQRLNAAKTDTGPQKRSRASKSKAAAPRRSFRSTRSRRR